MKKNLAAIFALTLLFACSNHHYDYEERKWSRRSEFDLDDARLRKFSKKPSERIRPSESMQAGIAKNNRRDFFQSDDEDNTADIFPDENQEYRGHFKIGEPYQLFGVSYFPQNYEDFEEIGIASWYGDDFHGKLTANGEIYNMGEMTAAHPTLPLPSLVRITNLKNGKSTIVRVNDRGPFAKNRVIDVSEKVADFLGFKDEGTTEVRVQLLRNDTDQMLEKLRIKN